LEFENVDPPETAIKSAKPHQGWLLVGRLQKRENFFAGRFSYPVCKHRQISKIWMVHVFTSQCINWNR
jgi:hypothetical protein